MEVLFSSDKDYWETPKKLFDELNKEFNFTLDPCASDTNHKCLKYYTKNDDGLSKDWSGKQYFVIHLTEEKKRINGLKNVLMKLKKKIQL